MAILYTFQIINPNQETPPFPPTLTPNWGEKLRKYTRSNDIRYVGLSDAITMIIFENEEALIKFSDEHRITDPVLLEDLEAWKSTHGIDYITRYYDLPESSITVPKIL